MTEVSDEEYDTARTFFYGRLLAEVEAQLRLRKDNTFVEILLESQRLLNRFPLSTGEKSSWAGKLVQAVKADPAVTRLNPVLFGDTDENVFEGGRLYLSHFKDLHSAMQFFDPKSAYALDDDRTELCGTTEVFLHRLRASREKSFGFYRDFPLSVWLDVRSLDSSAKSVVAAVTFVDSVTHFQMRFEFPTYTLIACIFVVNGRAEVSVQVCNKLRYGPGSKWIAELERFHKDYLSVPLAVYRLSADDPNVRAAADRAFKQYDGRPLAAWELHQYIMADLYSEQLPNFRAFLEFAKRESQLPYNSLGRNCQQFVLSGSLELGLPAFDALPAPVLALISQMEVIAGEDFERLQGYAALRTAIIEHAPLHGERMSVLCLAIKLLMAEVRTHVTPETLTAWVERDGYAGHTTALWHNLEGGIAKLLSALEHAHLQTLRWAAGVSPQAEVSSLLWYPVVRSPIVERVRVDMEKIRSLPQRVKGRECVML